MRLPAWKTCSVELNFPGTQHGKLNLIGVEDDEEYAVWMKSGVYPFRSTGIGIIAVRE